MNDASNPDPGGSAPLGTPPGAMTFGQILDRTYKLGRANFKLFLSIAAVPSTAILLLFAAIFGCMVSIAGPQIGAAQAGRAPFATASVFPAYLIGLIMLVAYPILFAVFALYMPAASYAATQTDQGAKVTFGDAYDVAWRNFWRYLWLMILPALYVIVPLVLIGAAITVGALLLHNSVDFGSNPAAMFFLIPLIVLLYLGVLVYCIWIVLRFALAFPASVVEGLTAWAALKRSTQLTKGARGRIFLVLLVVYAIIYAVNLVLMAIFMVVAAVGAGVALLAHVAQGSPAFFILIGLAALAYLLVLVACTLFSYVAYTTSLAVLYHDQRLRKDGVLPATPQLGEAV
jgi:hypothetical protein